MLRSVELSEFLIKNNHKEFLDFLYTNKKDIIVKELEERIDLSNLEADISHNLKCFNKIKVCVNFT